MMPKFTSLIILLGAIAFFAASVVGAITLNTSITSSAKINACTNAVYSAQQTGGDPSTHTEYCQAGYYVVGGINDTTNRNLQNPGSPPTGGYMVCCMNLP